MKFNKFLTESKEGKILHLSHLEDLMFEDGFDGLVKSIKFLESLKNMLSGDAQSPVDIRVKWDGAPAIVCGVNPGNGKFFVGTKSVFSANPKINYTDVDIELNHESEGLQKVLKTALKYLPLLGIKGVVQGDVLFIKNEITTDIIDNEKVILFKPNTIVYTVPENSNLAKRMLAAEIGIVFHTRYEGDSISELKAQSGVDTSSFNDTPKVWCRDATFVDVSGTANFTEDETKQATSILNRLKAMGSWGSSPMVLNKIANSNMFRTYVTTFTNTKIRQGKRIGDPSAHVIGLIQHVVQKLNLEIADAKKPETRTNREMKKKEVLEFFNKNFNTLVVVFENYNRIIELKELIIRKLETVKEIGTFLKTSNGYKVTNQEGFVAVSDGKVIKLINRMEFSHANFNTDRNWDQ